MVRSLVFVVTIILAAFSADGQTPSARPWTSGGTHDAGIRPPDSLLGFPLASRPARYHEVVRYITYLAEHSPRVKLLPLGTTYEGRSEHYLVFSSPANLQKLDEIRGAILKLSDPRVTDAAAARSIARSTPAIVWIGYGIHGDEVSSVDAALQVAYQLAAGTDTATQKVLNELVICLDPIENPDGRERFLAQMEQWNGPVPNSDAQSLHHTGLWPYGRGNHYLFDMNRDWFFLVHPEMQVRVQTAASWRPQVLIDSHEMGPYDTYLFSPPREPINPNISGITRRWWKVFAEDQGKAFDRYSWSYYSREWNDEWYPGYASSWALYIDAVGILYEQAGVDGSLVKRPDGTTLSYAEAVHHHIVSSLANFSTAAANRESLLNDYYASRREAMTPPPGQARVFYVVPGKNPTRAERLVDRLLMQQIEVRVAEKEFRADDLRSCAGETKESRTLPKGTYVIPMDQPQGRVARVILECDPRMSTKFLEEERKALEKEKDSKLYDVTAWSMPLAYNVEAYWSAAAPAAPGPLVTLLPKPAGSLQNPTAGYGYLVRCEDDRGMEALARLLQAGLKVRAAKEPFTIGGQTYPRGTLLLRRNENAPSFADVVRQVAEAAGVVVTGMPTAQSSDGPDLGGNDFVLLQEPRIAMLAGPDVSTTGMGAIWHLLEERLRMRITLLSSQQLGFADLRKYNVLLIPPTGGSQGLQGALGRGGVSRLRGWIENGGTLVAIGNAAAFAADTVNKLSAVRLRHQALKELDLYAKALEVEGKAGAPRIDSAALWGDRQLGADTLKVPRISLSEKELAMQDERGERFMPRGAILRVELDQEHWLAYGAGESVPALVFTSHAFLSRDPVRTPARFAPATKLRMSGLLWPEARERWAGTAYATREAVGRGQVILFAGEPNFRGSFHGTERLLVNALLLGPGFGASAAVEW